MRKVILHDSAFRRVGGLRTPFPLDMGSIARFRQRYWMTMRGGWRLASPSVSDTFCQTRAAIA